MGLKVGEVKLEKWNPRWREDFEHERQNLQCILDGLALSIQHIGSTSIEGLNAKPIIDIAVGVNSTLDFEKVKEKFVGLTDYSVKDNNAPGEILIRKGPEENRTFFIHIMEEEGGRMQQTISFRNILQQDRKICSEYEELKIRLAKKFSHNRKKYTAAKNDFIQSILCDQNSKPYRDKIV